MAKDFDFSSNTITPKWSGNVLSHLMFAFAAVFASFYIYWAILHIDIEENIIFLIVGGAAAGGLLFYGYENEAKKSFFKIAHNNMDNFEKSIKNKKNAEAALNSFARKQASYLVYFYCNALFSFLAITTTFYLFHNIPAPYNFLLSMFFSAGITAFTTTGSA